MAIESDSQKRERNLETKKKFIEQHAPILCVIDEQQKIDLVYYILAFADDDNCALISDFARKLGEER